MSPRDCAPFLLDERELSRAFPAIRRASKIFEEVILMSVRSKVKTNARRVLGQNYMKALIIVLILICVLFLFSLLMLIANTAVSFFGYLEILGHWNYLLSPAIVCVTLLLQMLLFSPLLVGTARWFYRLVGNEPGEIIDLFDFFAGAKHYFGSVWMELNLFIRGFFYAFLFTALPIVLTELGVNLFIGFWSPEPVPDSVAMVIGGMMSIAGIVLLAVTGIFSWIFLKRYALARYLYTEGGRSVRQAVKQSVYFMKGHKAELFLFDLSYLGWFISCILVAPAFFVLPYYLSAKALYARVIIEYGQRGKGQEGIGQEPTQEFGSEQPPVIILGPAEEEPEQAAFHEEPPSEAPEREE